jgi:RNA polymerase sigma-70 factor (ECF subfamily)
MCQSRESCARSASGRDSRVGTALHFQPAARSTSCRDLPAGLGLNARTFDRSRDGVSWAFAIAGYEILTARRKRDRRREVHADALFERADLADSPEQALISQQLSAALALATGALSDDERRSLELVSNGAADASIPAPTLRKRRQRAIQRLRDLWRRLHGEP